uniref:Acyl carrier protein n=1 Tax=Streptomyces sp. CNH287 TaxID=1288082 RepID=U6A3L9_9ACTN|nr:acyl carrier protein [Streptomyces sp. CNH287]
MARSEEEILSILAEILNHVCGTPPGKVQPGKTFVDDLDVDSLSMYEIAMVTQDRFGVEVPDEDMKSLRTVGDLIDYIRRAGVSA